MWNGHHSILVTLSGFCCRGTLARFINSSCAPNCEAQKWHDAATGEIRVGIFTAQDIDPGVELTYDYMFQHAGTAALAGAYRSARPLCMSASTGLSRYRCRCKGCGF